MNTLTPEIEGWAQAAEAKWQIPASLNIAAAMQESGLGAFTPPNSNNWHGIKDPSGHVTSTKEQNSDGTWYTIQAGFAVYPDPAASFDAYGKLLGLGSPYRAAVTAYLKSPKAPIDVDNLTTAIAKPYASALSYGVDLIHLQQVNDLFKLNGTPMATATVAPATTVTTTTTVNPVPAVYQSVTIDYGDVATQLLKNAESIISAVAVSGANYAIDQLPLGTLLSGFIGPTVVQQYVAQAMTALESQLSTKTISITPSSFVENTVLNMMNSELPELASFLGTSLVPMIGAAVTKALTSATTATK